MTALARKIAETPMAPYADLLRSMEPRDMRIVVTFLQEALSDAEAAKRQAEDEFLAQKEGEMGNSLSDSFLKLRGCVSFSQEEIASDDRLGYILSK